MEQSGAAVSALDPKQFIVNALNELGEALTLEQLLDRLKHQGLSDDVRIKEASWQLMSDGVIELTPERKLAHK